MALSWSHTVLLVKDEAKMLDFYTRVLGFEVTDRGPLPGDRYIIFLSQQPDEHHQLGMMPAREDDGPSNSLAHLAFRVEKMDELRKVIAAITAEDVGYRPVSHGNTWSVYFQDPEQNGIEIFCDSPFHVQQPQGKPWDVEMADDDLLAWTEENFKDKPLFSPRGDYIARRRQELADA